MNKRLPSARGRFGLFIIAGCVAVVCFAASYLIYAIVIRDVLEQPVFIAEEPTIEARPAPTQLPTFNPSPEISQQSLLEAAFEEAAPIEYPDDWPSEYKYPETMILVGASSGNIPAGESKGWNARLIYSGKYEEALNQLLAFFEADGWRMIDKTDRTPGGSIVLMEDDKRDRSGVLILEPNGSDPDQTLIVITIIHKESLIRESQTTPPTSVADLPSLTPSPEPSAEEIIAARADGIIVALKQRDMETLATFAHPTRGVRFSPYPYVQDSHLVFLPEELKELPERQTKYNWGSYDGSGLPIDLTFEEYYDRFIYDEDFASAESVGFNDGQNYGNTLNNSLEYYPDAMVYEYYFPGFDPQFQGMDWRALRLVFQNEGGTWYLVGIIHGEWTT